MRIDRETFDEWKAHPITELLLRACSIGAAQAREAWMAASFDGGTCDPVVLAGMRERARVLKEIEAISAEQIEDMVNEQDFGRG